MEEFIQKSFMNQKEENPFFSSALFKFFKFDRHSNFKRFLDNTKYTHHCYWDWLPRTIQKREREVIKFDRELFIILCKRKNIDPKPYEELYLEYLKVKIQTETIRFTTITQDRESNLMMALRPKSKYYDHSLNSLNVAKYCLMDPFEIFRYAATKLHGKFYPQGARVLNGYLWEKGPYKPVIYFDSKEHTQRYEYIRFLSLLQEMPELSELQISLIKHYKKCILELLKIQYELDHKKKLSAEKRLKKQAKAKIYSDEELKLIYRKGANLFHPDKNPNGEELFKKFKAFRDSLNVSEMKKMIDAFYL